MRAVTPWVQSRVGPGASALTPCGLPSSPCPGPAGLNTTVAPQSPRLGPGAGGRGTPPSMSLGSGQPTHQPESCLAPWLGQRCLGLRQGQKWLLRSCRGREGECPRDLMWGSGIQGFPWGCRCVPLPLPLPQPPVQPSICLQGLTPWIPVLYHSCLSSVCSNGPRLGQAAIRAPGRGSGLWENPGEHEATVFGPHLRHTCPLSPPPRFSVTASPTTSPLGPSRLPSQWGPAPTPTSTLTLLQDPPVAR